MYSQELYRITNKLLIQARDVGLLTNGQLAVMLYVMGLTKSTRNDVVVFSKEQIKSSWYAYNGQIACPPPEEDFSAYVRDLSSIHERGYLAVGLSMGEVMDDTRWDSCFLMSPELTAGVDYGRATPIWFHIPLFHLAKRLETDILTQMQDRNAGQDIEVYEVET